MASQLMASTSKRNKRCHPLRMNMREMQGIAHVIYLQLVNTLQLLSSTKGSLEDNCNEFKARLIGMWYVFHTRHI